MIPTDIKATQPMLAAPCDSPEEREQLMRDRRYVFDIKWDGVRALLCVDDGIARLTSRDGVDLTSRYPDVVANAAGLPDMALDGEIIVFNQATGRFDFSLALSRNSQTLPRRITRAAAVTPATFMAFDLLWHGGEDLRSRPLIDRLYALRELDTGGGIWKSLWEPNGEIMWGVVGSWGMEGMIAKRVTSRYRPGRGHDWVKLKRTKYVTAIVTGYVPGEGGRADQVGALHLALLKDEALVPIGKVGTGFARRHHKPILDTLNAGDQFLAEIEYLEVSKDGILRQPSFKGVRSDITREDCTMDQLR